VQQVADLDQVLQRGDELGRAALDMAAIDVELAVELLRQEAHAAREPGVLLQRDGGGHATLQRDQRAAMRGFRRQAGDDVARIGRHPLHELAAQPVLRRGGQEVPVAEPGGDPRARHLRRVGQRVAAGQREPVGRQRPAAQPRGVGAQRAQVAQPGEAMRRGAPAGRPAARAPVGGAVGFGRAQRADRAHHLELAAQQPRAARRIAGPQVAEGARRAVRHLDRLEVRQDAAGAAHDARHQRAPPAASRIGRSPRMAEIAAA
jgi:hypothetical protein